jgi:ribonuclease BN (tRNA processing enzyme)
MGREDLEEYSLCDRLICESYCLDKEAEEKNAYKYHHITAQDA